MAVISWRKREDRIAARGAEYRAGHITEAQFRAYLFGMNVRGEDIRLTMGAWAPPPPRQSFEDRRMDVSRSWLRDYFGGR